MSSDLWNGSDPLPQCGRVLLQCLGTLRSEMLAGRMRRPLRITSLFDSARGMATDRMEWGATGP
jgi:hypothetical protein